MCWTGEVHAAVAAIIVLCAWFDSGRSLPAYPGLAAGERTNWLLSIKSGCSA
jgi:hypothetical protein